MAQPDVIFEIDGIEFHRSERRASARELINLAGLDPATHDLVRLAGQSDQEKRLADADQVQLTPGSRFVTVFTGSTPVA